MASRRCQRIHQQSALLIKAGEQEECKLGLIARKSRSIIKKIKQVVSCSPDFTVQCAAHYAPSARSTQSKDQRNFPSDYLVKVMSGPTESRISEAYDKFHALVRFKSEECRPPNRKDEESIIFVVWSPPSRERNFEDRQRQANLFDWTDWIDTAGCQS